MNTNNFIENKIHSHVYECMTLSYQIKNMFINHILVDKYKCMQRTYLHAYNGSQIRNEILKSQSCFLDVQLHIYKPFLASEIVQRLYIYLYKCRHTFNEV